MNADVTPMNADDSLARNALPVKDIGELATGSMGTPIPIASSAFIGVTSAFIGVPKFFASASP